MLVIEIILQDSMEFFFTATDKGAVGAVLMIKEINDALWLTQNASAGPYIAVVSTSLFHDVVDELINYPKNVAGILVYENANQR